MNAAPSATEAPAVTFVEAASPHVMNTYGRLPIALSHGQGCRVWDINGKSYLDALGGIAVNTLGHNHPKLVPALQDQIAKIIHSCNYYHVPNQEALAKKLVELSGMTNVFFCSTGLEANEAALKLARKFGHDKGIERPEIVVYEKAFHGRSIATLSATGNPKIQAGFGPLVEGFIRVPVNDIESLKTATEGNPNVVAVFFEAIQGEGGVNPMHMDYLKAVRQLCDERDWLLMIDEVQCGMGRTGKWFAHQWAGIKADVMPLAKGLGSGVPVGAVVAGPKAANIFQPGNHGTTFGGNPLAMRAGVETIRIMEEEGLLENAATVGEHLKAALAKALAPELEAKTVKEIRGMGLMLGIDLAKPCGALVQQCADNGLLISVTADTVIRLVPPLIMTPAEADEVVSILCPLIKQLLQNAA
jgi:acetylornithine/N-succinyldiaminopimelate aminotransferase